MIYYEIGCDWEENYSSLDALNKAYNLGTEKPELKLGWNSFQGDTMFIEKYGDVFSLKVTPETIKVICWNGRDPRPSIKKWLEIC